MKIPRSFLCFAITAAAASADEPMHVYLTWQGDTSTTITVNFQTKEPVPKPTVYFDTTPRLGKRPEYASNAYGTSHRVPGLDAITERYIHTVELTGLQPNTTYHFIAGGKRKDFSIERKFRTIPAGDEPIHFITGGDMDIVQATANLMEVAGKQDPMFGVIGGDIAYGNGELKVYRKWDRWLRFWGQYMVAPDGRMIPMVLAIGNHEVAGGYSEDTENAPFYFGYFAQGGRTNFSRQFGANVALLALDTGHITSHKSQVPWIDEALTKYSDVKHTFAVYHIPLYPAHRPFDGGSSVQGREHWAPLFDKHHLTASFENHDHVHKRTPRIKANRINPEGTLYLGDGTFGKSSRTVDAERRWYEEVATETPHFWIVDAGPDEVKFSAMNQMGKIFDTVTLK